MCVGCVKLMCQAGSFLGDGLCVQCPANPFTLPGVNGSSIAACECVAGYTNAIHTREPARMQSLRPGHLQGLKSRLSNSWQRRTRIRYRDPSLSTLQEVQEGSRCANTLSSRLLYRDFCTCHQASCALEMRAGGLQRTSCSRYSRASRCHEGGGFQGRVCAREEWKREEAWGVFLVCVECFIALLQRYYSSHSSDRRAVLLCCCVESVEK